MQQTQHEPDFNAWLSVGLFPGSHRGGALAQQLRRSELPQGK